MVAGTRPGASKRATIKGRVGDDAALSHSSLFCVPDLRRMPLWIEVQTMAVTLGAAGAVAVQPPSQRLAPRDAGPVLSTCQTPQRTRLLAMLEPSMASPYEEPRRSSRELTLIGIVVWLGPCAPLWSPPRTLRVCRHHSVSLPHLPMVRQDISASLATDRDSADQRPLDLAH